MQPKPIDFRSVLDVDRQRRTVEMEGFAEHLRGLREHKEHPAETDYDVVHDEENRREREESSKKPAEKPEGAATPDEKDESAREDASKKTPAKTPAENGKGARLDIEA